MSESLWLFIYTKFVSVAYGIIAILILTNITIKKIFNVVEA